MTDVIKKTESENIVEFSSVDEIVADLRIGKMVIVVDDEERENEGDLLMAADKVTPEDINFMAKYGRGLICLTLTQSRCSLLRLPLMASQNSGLEETNFTVSIEASEGVTTGISAHDRARTIRVATAPGAQPSDIKQPGHIFPLMAKPGGVLTRAGHTEAGCDLTRLAGLNPAAVIVEILNDDGTMARRPDLIEFSKCHDIKIGTIADLIRYRVSNEQSIERISDQEIDTEFGKFRLMTFEDHINRDVHFALVKGKITDESNPLVRVHVENSLRDSIGVNHQSLGWPMKSALKQLSKEEDSILVALCYSSQPKDFLGMVKSIEAEQIEDSEREAESSVVRTYGTGSQILRDIGVKRMRVLSEPKKMQAISGFDLEITDYIEKE